MKLTVFRSSMGDALLVSRADQNRNRHILVDGGMIGSFRNYLAPYLHEKIKKASETIDLLCVSHIDNDHISGVVALIELLANWRARNYHMSKGNNNYKPSLKHEPPEISHIWHNSFAETYDFSKNYAELKTILGQLSSLTAGRNPKDSNLARIHDKVTGMENGIVLSQLIGNTALGIPLNEHFNNRPIKCNGSTTSKNVKKIAGFELTIIGPFAKAIKKLKKEWLEWEEDHSEKMKSIFEKWDLATRGSKNNSLTFKEVYLGSNSDSEFGERSSVSFPNLASIMFLVESDGKSILMTGDGLSEDIIKGLKVNGKLDSNDQFKVDILKVQHHGAIANIDEDFCKTVKASHYVFCGNGSHTNPELRVVDLIFEHHPKDSKFKFWFNANPKDQLTPLQKTQMKLVEQRVKELKNIDVTGFFDYHFINRTNDYFEIPL